MCAYWGGQLSFDVPANAFKIARRKKMDNVHAQLWRQPICPRSQWIFIPTDEVGLCSFCERQLTIDQELAFIKRHKKSIQDHCIVID